MAGRYSNGHRWRRIRARVLREETTCWLCGQPVDQTIPTPHPFSAEVDHVRPVAQGGDLYDRANLRLTHRRCNTARNRKTQTPTQPAGPLPTSRDWASPIQEINP